MPLIFKVQIDIISSMINEIVRMEISEILGLPNF